MNKLKILEKRSDNMKYPCNAEKYKRQNKTSHCTYSYKIYSSIVHKVGTFCKYIFKNGLWTLKREYNHIFVRATVGISLMHGPFCLGEAHGA
jgi:hypothetical protein